MKQKTTLALVIMLTMSITACKEKKQSNDIITKIQHKKETVKGPQKMSDFKYDKQIEWVGGHYTISIHRYADTNLEMATDEEGRKYYDNKIDLKITRQDGSVFYQKTFSKSDFTSFTDNEYGKKGALIGFMFDTVDDDNICFGASVGSPDANSDEYVPIDVLISRHGSLSIRNAQSLDMETQQKSQPKKSELEMAEEEGI